MNRSSSSPSSFGPARRRPERSAMSRFSPAAGPAGHSTGPWPQLPGLVEFDPSTHQVSIDRSALPRTSPLIYWGRGTGGRILPEAVCEARVLLIASRGAARTREGSVLLARLPEPRSTLLVSGHADHAAIRSGVAAVREAGATLVVGLGGGTALDVAKSVAALAGQEGEIDPAAYQLGERQVDETKALPWIALPTTSGTGSESTDNAVIELGAEKRSIRGLPPPSLIIADPALTDELPFESTAIAAVDALAQALEVLTNGAATSAVQQVALAAFAALARGIEDLILAAESTGEPPHPATDRPVAIESPTRDMLSWGSLLMGIAFAHARLGLPHALVHFCPRFGLRHGHMVGLLLGAGLAVQARGDRETEARLARAAQHLPTARSENANELLSWVNDRISRLFARAGLPTSLAGAGLRSADLAWIMEHELAHRPHFGIPPRPAAPADLKAVLLQAHHPT